MGQEKSYSYLSSINERDALANNLETNKAVKLTLKKDFEGALNIFTELENKEMVLILKKCIELQPLFEQFLNGDITLAKYKRVTKKFPDEVKEIVHYKYPNLEFIELKNLERKFREKIEGIIDDLLSKNTLESLIEARKVYEKHIGVVKKNYNFDKYFIKTISLIPYSNYEKLYYIEWSDVDKLINNFLLEESKSFIKAELIIKQIKVIHKNRDIIQTIIRKFNKTFDAKLRQNYREAKLKCFLREYNKHSFYFLDKHNKVNTMVEPFFLQRRIYCIYYLNENCDLFLDMLKNHMGCMDVIPSENQKAFYHAIIKSTSKTRDYSIFEFFPESIIKSHNFNEVLKDTLSEDEDSIRRIVELLKGKENQKLMEEMFLSIFDKELTFSDTKQAPKFNLEKAEILINKYKENDIIIRKTKASKVFIKLLAVFELFIVIALALGITSTSAFAFKKDLYFIAMMILLSGLFFGVWFFIRFKEIITFKKEKRLLKARMLIDKLEAENKIILKKVYLGID